MKVKYIISLLRILISDINVRKFSEKGEQRAETEQTVALLKELLNDILDDDSLHERHLK